jgi:hypothetical protein
LTTGRYLVQSTADGLLYYEATSYTCSCPDSRKHAAEGLRCKHAWSLEILAVASVIASREAEEAAAAASSQDADILDLDPDAPIPFILTSKGEATIARSRPSSRNPLCRRPWKSLTDSAVSGVFAR